MNVAELREALAKMPAHWPVHVAVRADGSGYRAACESCHARWPRWDDAMAEYVEQNYRKVPMLLDTSLAVGAKLVTQADAQAAIEDAVREAFVHSGADWSPQDVAAVLARLKQGVAR